MPIDPYSPAIAKLDKYDPVRRDYLTGRWTIRQLAKRYGMGLSSVQRRAFLDKWGQQRKELREGPQKPREMASLGLTVNEIMSALGLPEHEASTAAGPLTPAQLLRVEHVTLARAVGTGGLAPHIQAGQFLLQNHMPETYGKQANNASATLRVIVDTGYTLRAGVTLEAEGPVQALAAPDTPLLPG